MPDPFSSEPRLVAEPTPGDNALALSVGELSSKLKRMVEGEFGHVRLRGEISGFKRAASGHVYLALKDESAVIDGVMWKGVANALAFSPQDGVEVIATGKLTIYPGRSKYQIVIERMELAGAGALMALLEKLRAQLAGEGLFDRDRKQPLPFLPRVIGVVTSPTGAVIRDILHRLEDRCPTRVIVWPVKVQGEGAAAEVAAAVRGFDALPTDGPVPRPDLVIVARGGGSIEDLWAFNEEVVVRAVAACSIPIISAVGHETDTTLCDHAADLRAPTPTAAAEIAVPVLAELRLTIDSHRQRTERCARRYVERGRERLTALARLLPKRDALLGPQRQRADDAGARLDRGLERRVTVARGQLDRATGALRPAVLQRQVDSARHRLESTWRLVQTLNPDNVLERGYARVTARDGATLMSSAAVTAAGALTLRFRDGSVDVAVDPGDGKTPDKPRRVERSAPKAYAAPIPEQPTLL
ncbi:exodeoxyribonuclease VII large subunit [Sphingomonas sp. SORGH_AS802]|uniref:exodeoxyribonuclease VII large subunit n=1 Tax=unclassified Sphingomonas TaxID=196159 RepID=UPI00285A9110|nr:MULTISPECIES: exodeoxyribonuclease VII large subunit [unclassified Sphingomonas]MDR6128916.1 exodeoxyribonuclease VII large subunit [Sphingomonas sp. SORGH_AS_0438]MDR6136073.1 exodeoxyribonuclease VII large subunit [Sphingomonas sp. SORGH_AS_0802]